MNQSKKIALVFMVLMALSIIYLSWYSVQHSMDEARPFEINDPHLSERILIATQGSAYKNTVVHEVINRLKSQPLYIRVIDVSALPEIRENDWSAIVILHTWEYWKPQQEARNFIDRAERLDKIVMLSTSEAGKNKIEKIDGITSASDMNDINAKAEEIVTRINSILTRHISYYFQPATGLAP